MAKLSGFWTTGGATGDQQVSYTQAQWAMAAKVMAGCNDFEGIASRLLNKLACTVTGANTVSMNTGGAMVDGKWFYLDAAQDINIPSASPGTVRIDRIVLRCLWSGFNVSAYVLTGTTTPPALTPQTRGTEWMIYCYQASVTDAGVVTLTDERDWATPGLDATSLTQIAGALQIKDLGVTTGKVAANAIDDTKLRDSAALSVIGRGENSIGNPADIATVSDGDVLRRSGVTLGFGQIATAGITDLAVTTGKLAADAVTPAKIANRTRSFLVEPMSEVIVYGTYGLKMPNEAVSNVYGSFQIPSDYASGMTVKAVINTDANNAQIYSSLAVQYGAVGEDTGVHADYSALQQTLCYQYVHTLTNPVNLSSPTAGDFVRLTYQRDAVNVLDTLNAEARILGFEVSYTADS